ncbi:MULTISPECIES: pyroglutamyl-peptidase I [unclassified Facklamia]|uniref:pyroglutamyl-peptidase I n=1 Tax=Aerococcaceae TaxID=186827 RepID=UPI0013BAD16D|nr:MULTISPECIES: pyroglutamyl-peptidase I [unclassified Facklamia]NEW65069.1 pyroglutamyl-peptidase I [Facklamia sp. 252]NEW68726.1 pyroglutamyl-peptidase I [Facklamia sp. 253]QQD65133.1 pyroglutamyl-peptidase I [Aerococcaceae bacterium zg-252]
MKLLVTGFEPFGDESVNPALEAVKLLPDSIAGAEIIKLEIPTVFHKSGKMLETAIKEIQPDAIICVGQAGGRSAITPERVAINQDDASIKDNEGNQPIDEPIQSDGPPAYFSTLPIKAIVAAIQEAGIPAQVSNTAGTYVCNHLMYQARYYAEQYLSANASVGFIHVPYMPSQVVNKPNVASMKLDTIVKALTIAIEVVVQKFGQVDVSFIGGATH